MSFLDISIAIIPVIAILLFIYFRDKFEKEPLGLLILTVLAGALAAVPVIILNGYLEKFSLFLLAKRGSAFFDAFYSAALIEEFCKWSFFMLLIWWNKNFNERFDGIVYAAFVSLGFAGLENLMYVSTHGSGVGILRAFTAVPAHAIFGVFMGYYLGLAKFANSGKRAYFLIMSLLIPILIHGLYNYILMHGSPVLLIAFFPFLIFYFYPCLEKNEEIKQYFYF
jgi:protease PrsW